MTRILTFPKLKFEFKQNEDKLYSLKKPLIIADEDKTIIINPSDHDGVFLFNLASVPFYLRWLHKPNSRQTLYASIAHDYFYCSNKTKRLKDDILFFKLTKSEQKRITEDLPFFKKRFTRFRYFITRWALFILLRLFGWLNKA